MEQAVYVEMVKKAHEYSDESTQKKYLEACSRFRFPYWDPCLPRQLFPDPNTELDDTSGIPYEFGIPKIVSARKVFLRKPQNPDQLIEEDNPLYQFRFPDGLEIESQDNPNAFWQRPSDNVLLDEDSLHGSEYTVRAPDANGIQNDAYINRYLRHHLQSDIGSSLYRVLTSAQNWAMFSNDVLDNEEKNEARARKVRAIIDQSLEGFHDDIHVLLGQGELQNGSGQIGDPRYAAFDPIFWLHHWYVTKDD
jgi:Common central domain of tyrosinase